jgi:ESX secretion system protein EccC
LASSSPQLADLLGIGDPGAIDPAVAWRPRSPHDRLRVPFGLDDTGRPVELDLKMAALNGMGPHGMVIGAAGSGKAELLRTLLYALAATHSPDELNLFLVAFADDGTFLGVDQLPHTSAVVPNLRADLSLADRLYDALAGELARRQQLLHWSGPYTSRETYAEARAEGAQLDSIPSLLVVIDEFSELLGSKPDLVSLLVQIGRVGRGLGVHLLLATDVLEAGRLRGLDGYLSYRISLRTSSAAESRAVIGVSDAYELPDQPGTGYLKAGVDAPERFQAASVDPVLAEMLVERLRGQGTPAYRIWPPPLDEPPAPEALLPPPHAEWPGRGRLQVPIGIVDKPYEHRQDLLWLDLSGDRGNVAIVGGPRSGKSTLVRTLVRSLELTHTPSQVGFYPPVATGVLTTLMNLRAQLRRENRIEPDGFPAHVFVVIDGWRAEHEPAVTTLAAHGPGYGIHVVATAERWEEFPAAIKELLQTKLELRLDDPAGSEIHPRLAASVPGDRPGRGLTTDKLHFLGAAPADLRQ